MPAPFGPMIAHLWFAATDQSISLSIGRPLRETVSEEKSTTSAISCLSLAFEVVEFAYKRLINNCWRKKISVLVVFDVDSTLIAHEAIEEIADVLGKKDEVAKITAASMRGEIDFEQSLIQRVKLLQGVSEENLLNIALDFQINHGAKELIQHIHDLGGRACAVSGGFGSLLKPLAKKLHLDDYIANTLELKDGKLTGGLVPPIVDAKAKRAALVQWSEEYGIPMSKTVAIGDGANDLEMMDAAAVSIGFMPKPIVAEACDHLLSEPDFTPVIELLP